MIKPYTACITDKLEDEDVAGCCLRRDTDLKRYSSMSHYFKSSAHEKPAFRGTMSRLVRRAIKLPLMQLKNDKTIHNLYNGQAEILKLLVLLQLMTVSNCGLNASHQGTSHLHPSSIKLVFYECHKVPRFGGGFGLRCFQPLSAAAWLPSLPGRTTGRLVATTPCSSRTKGTFPSGTIAHPSKSNQPVSRRSKPISRSLLMGEQPHPWQLLHHQDRKNRHRSSKPPGR